MKFVPLKLSELPTLKIGTILYDPNGDEYTFQRYDQRRYYRSHVYVTNFSEQFEWIDLRKLSLTNPNATEATMESIKKYLEKHRDLFFTLGVMLILDHFVFAGAFREKIKQLLDSFLQKKGTKALEDLAHE